jgi:tripartite-type tricarboxylate transporter receptor subunit TctC
MRLQLLLVVVVLLASPAALAQQQPALVIYEPYGAESVTDESVRIMQSALEAGVGGTLDIRHRDGTAGGAAMAALRRAPPDGRTLVVIELSTRALHERLHAQERPRLDELTPIAKLTGGISLALVVAQASPIRNWDDLKATARKRALTVVDIGRDAGMGIELRWLEHALGRPFHDRVRGTRQQILAALAQGRADVGLIASATLEAHTGAAAPPVRAIVSFGPERHPGLPEVPTFAEVSGDKMAAMVGSIVVFGPPGLPGETANQLAALFLRAGTDPQVRAAAAAAHFPLEVGGPELARDALHHIEQVMRIYVKTHHLPAE